MVVAGNKAISVVHPIQQWIEAATSPLSLAIGALSCRGAHRRLSQAYPYPLGIDNRKRRLEWHFGATSSVG